MAKKKEKEAAPKEKLKLAKYWAAACGGCDVSLLDVHEKILDIAAIADILFWPIALDFKEKDVEGYPDKHIDVCFFNGAVRNSENEHMAKLLRQKSKVLVAYGSCAHLGGIPALANLHNKKEIFERAYHDSESTDNPDFDGPKEVTKVPEGELTIPKFYDTVFSLDQVVKVDYYLPGCPPSVDRIWEVVGAIASGKLPPAGSVVGAQEKTLCDTCERKKEDKKLKEFKRIDRHIPEPEKCLLDQGFICMGPVTRAGCGELCIKANQTCRGCYGPGPDVHDQGVRFLSALASVIDAETEAEIAKILNTIEDPTKTFYRFCMSKSLLRRKLYEKN